MLSHVEIWHCNKTLADSFTNTNSISLNTMIKKAIDCHTKYQIERAPESRPPFETKMPAQILFLSRECIEWNPI